MRPGKSLAAAIATVLLYAVSLVALAPVQSVTIDPSSPIQVGAVAHAAPQTQQEICRDYEDSPAQLGACKDGFTGGTRNEPRANVCSAFTGGQAAACFAGYDGYVNEGRGPPDDGAGDLGAADGGNPPECNSGDFSWFICSAMEWIHDTVTFIEREIIEPFLDTPSLAFEGPLYEIWKVMRGLASVAFVIVFILLIAANTLSIDIKTYHVRRMLPRLVAAAIAVQASYLLSAVAVDVSNVLGGGLFDLINGLIPEYPDNISGGEVATTYGTLGLGALIGAAMVASAVASGAIFLVLIGVIVGVALTFLTLVLRQVIITLLIILAPLAFVAWVLPNTEELFENWSELFVKLLLMYPLIMLFFAAGKVFSVAAGAAAGTSTVAPLFALVGLVAPLFMIPLAFNFAGSLFKGSRNMLLRAAGKAHSSVADKIKDSKQMENYRGKRAAAGAVALANTNKRLDDWQNDPNAGRGKRLLANHRQGLLLAQAGLQRGDLGLASQLGRQKTLQDEIKRAGKDMDDMNVGRPDYEKLAGANSRDELPSMLRPYYTVAGQAAALRKLHKEKALDESGHAHDNLVRMKDRQRAEEIRRLSMQGDGGVVYISDPAIASGGLDGKGRVKPDVGSKIKAGNLANLMTSTEALDRTFGMNTSGIPSKHTRRIGEVDANGKLTGNLHFVERELDRHGLVGGMALSMTPETLKTALQGRFSGDSNASGRRHMKELLTNANAQRRIHVLERYANALRHHGYNNEADSVLKNVDNLKGLRDNANDLIND